MKTTKITRVIRREINGVFLTVGPQGITFRLKHKPKEETFLLTWEKALLNAVVETSKPRPLIEVKAIPDNPKQVNMFPDVTYQSYVHNNQVYDRIEGGAGDVTPENDAQITS